MWKASHLLDVRCNRPSFSLSCCNLYTHLYCIFLPVNKIKFLFPWRDETSKWTRGILVFWVEDAGSSCFFLCYVDMLNKFAVRVWIQRKCFSTAGLYLEPHLYNWDEKLSHCHPVMSYKEAQPAWSVEGRGCVPENTRLTDIWKEWPSLGWPGEGWGALKAKSLLQFDPLDILLCLENKEHTMKQ